MSFGRYIEVGKMDELGRMDSPMHRLDARVKTLTTIAFIVTVMSFSRYEVSALMSFFLYPFVLMAVGRIPPGYIVRKLLIASPFALAVGMFNPLLDQQVRGSLGSHGISGGWMSFASIVIRFSLTVSAALTLVACTGIHRLCAGLERMGLPRVFAVQLCLLYRYLFVIADEGLRMIRGVEMRSMGRRSLKFATYVSLIGHLLLRAMDRAQRVYQAMVSRGFAGQFRVMRPTVVCWRDVAFLAGWLAFFAAARTWNMADELGRLLTETGA
jgi:cobalt/nickel transport system permease protein